jgi:hypothetical protein
MDRICLINLENPSTFVYLVWHPFGAFQVLSI